MARFRGSFSRTDRELGMGIPSAFHDQPRDVVRGSGSVGRRDGEMLVYGRRGAQEEPLRGPSERQLQTCTAPASGCQENQQTERVTL